MSTVELPSCPVCKLEYDEVIPKVLRCGHTVCQSCVDGLMEQNFINYRDYKVACPKEHLMTDLPKNFVVEEAVEMIKKLEAKTKPPNDSLKCSGCGKMECEADSFICRNCVQTSLNYDITDFAAAQSSSNFKSFAFCGSCAVRIHISAGHETLPYFSITSRFQFESQLTGVSLQKKELTQKITTVDRDYNVWKETVRRTYEEIDKMTEMMRKSKSSEIQREFAKTISEECNKLAIYANSVNECFSTGNTNYQVGFNELVASNLRDELDKCQEVPEKTPKFVCTGCGDKETKERMLCCRKCFKTVKSLMNGKINAANFNSVDTNTLPICMPCVFTNHSPGDHTVVKFADVLEKYRVAGEVMRLRKKVAEIRKKFGELLHTSEQNSTLMKSYDNKIGTMWQSADATRGLPEQDDVFSKLDKYLEEAEPIINSLHTRAEFDRNLLESVVEHETEG